MQDGEVQNQPIPKQVKYSANLKTRLFKTNQPETELGAKNSSVADKAVEAWNWG